MPRSFAKIQVTARLLCLIILLTSYITACTPSSSMPASPTGQTTASPSPLPTMPTYNTPTPPPTLPIPAVFHESPAMEAMVRSSQLDSVTQRLPMRPKVVQPVEKIGTYGGTWRMVIEPNSDGSPFIRTVAYEPLVRWNRDWSAVEPNLADNYSINRTATEFTIKLRRGLRWSDGYPFTTQDIRFWYNNVLLNKDLMPVTPVWLKTRGDVATFEFVDDLTFKVKFTYPNRLFLEQLASPEALILTAFPAHYVQKFHLDFADPAELTKLVQAGHFTSWSELFIRQIGVKAADIGSYVDPERPRMSAWVPDYGKPGEPTTLVWRRNPYYWKVDTQGNQLPYIDEVDFKIVNNSDEAINYAMNGEVDMQNLSELGIDVASIFGSLRNSEFSLYSLSEGANNVMVVNLNLTHPDPIKRAIFQNRDFRIGLSYAINRQEIINLVYKGKGKPWQAAPLENSLFYDPSMGTQYTEYSLAKANEYLDKAGFQKDQMGKRLRPDGLPISFSIEVAENNPRQIAMLNLIARYWAAVGIDVHPQPESLPLIQANIHSNLHDAVAWQGGSTYYADVLLNPNNYVPNNESSYWAVSWANWYNQVPGYENQAPGNSVDTALAAYNGVSMAQNPNVQIRLMKGVLALARDNFWTIGIASGSQQYGIVRRNFHNVPANMPAAWIYPDPAPTNPEQFFFGS